MQATIKETILSDGSPVYDVVKPLGKVDLIGAPCAITFCCFDQTAADKLLDLLNNQCVDIFLHRQ